MLENEAIKAPPTAISAGPNSLLSFRVFAFPEQIGPGRYHFIVNQILQNGNPQVADFFADSGADIRVGPEGGTYTATLFFLFELGGIKDWNNLDQQKLLGEINPNSYEYSWPDAKVLVTAKIT